MIYSISYDLNRPGQKYADLIEAIKVSGAWWHYLQSTWLVDTNLTAQQLFNRLRPHIDDNDIVLIIGVTRDYSGWLPEKAWNWLKERMAKAA